MSNLAQQEKRKHLVYFGALTGYGLTLLPTGILFMLIFGSVFGPPMEATETRYLVELSLSALSTYFVGVIGCLIIGLVAYFLRMNRLLYVSLAIPILFGLISCGILSLLFE